MARGRVSASEYWKAAADVRTLPNRILNWTGLLPVRETGSGPAMECAAVRILCRQHASILGCG